MSLKNSIWELKVYSHFFREIAVGNKNFEIRKKKHDYSVGDFLILKEVNFDDHEINRVLKKITYILDDQDYVKEGHVILGFSESHVETDLF